MSQKIYLTILKSGIYLSLITVFLLFKSMLYPYITSKQFSFNILIEVLFAIWLVFIIKYPNFRPSKSWISISLISFFTVITISSFTGVDFNLSFWGDAERMLGVFHLLHFLAYYFIIITVMQTWQDWRNFLTTSVVVATVIVLYGFIKGIHFSTLGNTAYLSGYVIFNIYFALILFFRHKIKNITIAKNWIPWLYIGAAIILTSVLRTTHTRGAYVGLAVSFLILLIYFIIVSKNIKIKIASLVVLILISSLIAIAWLKPNLALVKNSSILSTVSQINLEASTFQTRLIAWRAAIKDLPNHWLLGTGHGNFAITFDKHFDPEFYIHTPTETYFDRAHNNIIDIVSTTGLLGLITYLSILITAGYYLVKGYFKGKIKRYDFILLVSLLVAYFIQNLVVFDSLVTYMSLMMTLGFIYWLSKKEETKFAKDELFADKEFYILGIIGVAMLLVVYQFNVLPFKMMQQTINGQISYEIGRPVVAANYYQKAFEYNTVLDRDSRQSFARQIIAMPNILDKVSKQEASDILDYAIYLVRQNVAYNPQDSLMQTELAQLLNITAQFNENNNDRFYFYSNQALDAINIAIDSSPRRVQLYFIKARIYETRNELDQTIETLKYAVSLNEQYPDSSCNLARYYFIDQNKEDGFAIMDKCLDLGGGTTLTPVSYVESLINYYWAKEDWTRSLVLYEHFKTLDNSAETQVALAKLYLQFGQIDKSIEAATQAIEINPGKYKDLAEDFITKVKNNDYQEFLPQEQQDD